LINKFNVILLAVFFLNACKPAEKSQAVIFEAETISCKGDGYFCKKDINNYKSKCKELSTSLDSKLTEGWRVVSSSAKEKVVSSDSYNTTSCIGTEYVIER